MVRGTTPREVYIIDPSYGIDLSDCSQIWVTITDSTRRDHTWDLTRVEVDAENSILILNLTQQETLAFAVGTATVQIRFLTSAGKAFASDPDDPAAKFEIKNVRRDGVIE